MEIIKFIKNLFKEKKSKKDIKVSFDFDYTLTEPEIQKYALELIERGIEVHIVTARFENENNSELFRIAKLLNISKENIHFTSHRPKVEFFKNSNFLFHVDDDPDELVKMIRCSTIGVNGIRRGFKLRCEKYIKMYSN